MLKVVPATNASAQIIHAGRFPIEPAHVLEDGASIVLRLRAGSRVEVRITGNDQIEIMSEGRPVIVRSDSPILAQAPDHPSSPLVIAAGDLALVRELRLLNANFSELFFECVDADECLEHVQDWQDTHPEREPGRVLTTLAEHHISKIEDLIEAIIDRGARGLNRPERGLTREQAAEQAARGLDEQGRETQE